MKLSSIFKRAKREVDKRGGVDVGVGRGRL